MVVGGGLDSLQGEGETCKEGVGGVNEEGLYPDAHYVYNLLTHKLKNFVSLVKLFKVLTFIII